MYVCVSVYVRTHVYTYIHKQTFFVRFNPFFIILCLTYYSSAHNFTYLSFLKSLHTPVHNQY